MKVQAAILASVLTMASSTASAETLSDMQEGALYATGGILLLNHIMKHRQQGYVGYPAGLTTTYPPASVGYYPPADPVQKAYEEGVRQRQQAEMQERMTRAYSCGRYGRDCEE